MFDFLERLYNGGKVTDVGLAKAVSREWITQAQADEIKASKPIA